MSAPRVLCGICGQRWPWLYTAYWFVEGMTLRPEIQTQPGNFADGYLDDCARLVFVPRPALCYIPLCSRKCGKVNVDYVGGFVRANTADNAAIRIYLKAQLPDWWPQDERQAAS